MAGSATFNWGAIEAKIQAAMDAPAKQTEISKALEDKIKSGNLGGGLLPPAELGDMFKEMLEESIYSHVGSYTEYAAYVLAHHDVSDPTSIGDGKYEIVVSPAGDMSRESLIPKYFPDGISELDMLLNNGVNHTMNKIYGKWHGKWVGSKTDIGTTNFYEDAIGDFMGMYGEKYGVVDITLDSEYAS